MTHLFMFFHTHANKSNHFFIFITNKNKNHIA